MCLLRYVSLISKMLLKLMVYNSVGLLYIHPVGRRRRPKIFDEKDG